MSLRPRGWREAEAAAWAPLTSATTLTPRRLKPCAISTETTLPPPEETTSAESVGFTSKFRRMRSASPDVFSRNMAWRWPLAPTTRLWKVRDSSTMGLKPGKEP
jgi:hypothetical protein